MRVVSTVLRFAGFRLDSAKLEQVRLCSHCSSISPVSCAVGTTTNPADVNLLRTSKLQ